MQISTHKLPPVSISLTCNVRTRAAKVENNIKLSLNSNYLIPISNVLLNSPPFFLSFFSYCVCARSFVLNNNIEIAFHCPPTPLTQHSTTQKSQLSNKLDERSPDCSLFLLLESARNCFISHSSLIHNKRVN